MNKYEFACGTNHEITVFYFADNYNNAISNFLRDFDNHKLPILSMYVGYDVYVSNRTTNRITAVLHPYRTGDERINISSFAD